MRNGRMVVIADSEERENEGDLVIPAQMATPQAINFMATHGRGLICVAITQARADALGLVSLGTADSSRHGTAFTRSIEAKDGVGTGISARDRARTIATVVNPAKGAQDLVSPGHVFPLVARSGGVLVRAGHTEASVDLARLAGLMPAAVICEIMNADGTMARVPDLVSFARQHRLKIGSIEDLVAHRLAHERLVQQIAETTVDLGCGESFDVRVFTTTFESGEHLALSKGDLTKPAPLLVRVHTVDPLRDLVGAGCGLGREPVIGAVLKMICREGRGVLVLIRDRDHGSESISRWITRTSDSLGEADKLSQQRQIEIGIGLQILRHLGVSDRTFLANVPHSISGGIESF